MKVSAGRILAFLCANLFLLPMPASARSSGVPGENSKPLMRDPLLTTQGDLSGHTSSPEILCQNTPTCLITFSAHLQSGPYPYHGPDGDLGKPFLDGRDAHTGERYHTSRAGTRYAENEYYQDNRVIFHVPAHFNSKKPWSYLIYFHGHHTVIGEKVYSDEILDQVNASGKNIILIAPQFAKNAADSSPGKFYQAGQFQNFVTEAQNVVKNVLKLKKKAFHLLQQAPIFLAAYSGGYKPLAYVLDGGGLDNRIHGVLLLDGLYDEFEKLKGWIMRHPQAVWWNLYGESTAKNTLSFMEDLRRKGISFHQASVFPSDKRKGICFSKMTTPHEEIPKRGPPYHPITEFLKRFSPFSP